MNLTTLFTTLQEPDALFTALMPALCEALSCDRSFLYVRQPDSGRGRITHCYSRHPDGEDLTGADWIEEGEAANTDPLMVLALNDPTAVYISDIETAPSDQLDLAYEREKFKHRALIHAPIYHEDQLYGILEPCIFDRPHEWTEADRTLIADVQAQLGEWVASYVAQHPPT